MLFSRPVVFVASLLSISVVNAEALDRLLDKMNQAMTSNNYRGTLVIRQADQLQTLSVQHGNNGKGVWEMMESLNGESRKIIRQNGKVTTIFPSRGLVTISRDQAASPLHPQLPENRHILKKFYQLKLDGEDRIADRPAQILQVIPRDHFRYGFRFWLEKNTGLLLKCDLMDEKGTVIEQLMFSELVLLKQPPRLPQSPEETQNYRVVDLDKGLSPSSNGGWAVRALPAGFMLTRHSIKSAADERSQVHHLVYSDGMASVSVFVEKHRDDEKALLGVSRMGAVNAFSLHLNDNHITAIGEVPVATVRMIGESVRRQP